ncbi:deacylase/carboxypeptidase superfamily protein [Geothrix limicola]|uniref:Deacylase/carboxypeptidase superfamily protein n=1 Tax=Geothrix limicola TaxID=2927978 RepID=A0ABQ5QBK2_9BACT|nr:M14 family zinc carboxypeptidase [Geothrix limicola]GLH71835.1 deacylase/carboxypeptidase superfamily protein [Geothrix limicola]
MRMPSRPALLALLCAAPLMAGLPPGLLPAADHRPDVPQPDLGTRYTPHHALLAYARALAAAAPERVRMSILNVTEEGYEQPFLVISSPENLRRLDEWKALNAKLADPRTCPEEEARRITETSPVFVWLGYSVHGSEAAGSEAALAVAYHFASARSPEVLKQLDRVVLLMDLTQNPDGRARHLQGVAEASTPFKANDPLDAQNTAQWPGGRFNHRLFDLNRDWVWQTQGEIRAETAAFLQWNPQVAVDVHEMTPESSYYFPPTMQPIHEGLPEAFSGRWQATFGKGVARAFDARGWAYFSRDVFDLFYPGYGDSWPTFQGAVGMTFETAGQGGVAYRRQDEDILTLEGRIQRHTASCLAVVATAAAERQALLWDFQQARRDRAALGDRAGAFLLGEGEDPSRTRALVALLQRNGIDVLRTTRELATAGLEPIGLAQGAGLPAGSYLVPLDQAKGALAQALLEAEAHMGPKPTYDTTAWSLPIAFHVPAWRAKVRPKVDAATLVPPAETGLPDAAWGYLIPAGHEGAEKTLAALLQEGFKATALAEPARHLDQRLPAGTIVLPLRGNPPTLKARLHALARQNQHPVLPTDTAQMGLGPDLGSNRALILKTPRIAVLMDRPASPTAFGALAHTLTEAGLAFVQLRADRLAAAPLQRYTHLVLVDDEAQGKGWQQALGEGGAAKLKAWVAEGGSLLAFQGGAAYASRAGLTATGYHLLAKGAEEARLKEKDPKREAPKVDPADLVRPWDKREERSLEESIPGAFLKVRVDGTHPLAWGLHAEQGAAVLDTSDPVLHLSAGGENPLYYAKEELRVSGLLPRAMEAKLQQSAYAIREKSGQGAIILLAGDPVFRAQTPFTRRILFNAIFFGAYRPTND